MVIRGRVDQMPDHLLARPSALQHGNAALILAHRAQQWFCTVNRPQQPFGDLLHASCFLPMNCHSNDVNIISEMIPSEVTQYTHHTSRMSFSICVRYSENPSAIRAAA